ncbi:MAG: hypothetical protein ACD_20C00330G0001 [uncultured bacterium]|nr:MAG: hypothetical protein ACD_20C00330G0001 [uncultured bacterium]
MLENLILIRDFLYRWFLIGFILLFVSSLLYMIGKDFSAELAQSLFRMNVEDYHRFMVYFLGLTKIFLFFFVLSPALALHSLIHSFNKKNN